MDPLLAPVEGATHQELGGISIDTVQAANGRITLVSAKSGDFPPWQAVSRMRENVRPTPMSLHPLGQRRRHRRLFPQ